MKRISEIIKTLSVLLGSVIGAGFVSGAELTIFFGTIDFVPFLFVSGCLFFLGFSVVYLYENNCNGNKTDNKFFECILLISCTVFSAAMIAGITDLFAFCGVARFIPSLVCVVFFYLLYEKGVDFIEKINGIIMPITIILSLIFIYYSNKCCNQIVTIPQPKKNFIFPVLFSFLNIFITIPVAKESIKNKSKFSVIFSFVLFSFIFVYFAFIILVTVKNSGTVDFALPLLRAFIGNRIIYGAFGVCIFLCSFTSFYACCFPPAIKTRNRYGKKTVLILLLLVYLLSFAGLGKIIKWVYPLFGAAGAAYVCKALFILIKNKVMYKKSVKADNTIKQKTEELLCQKERKAK